MSSSRGSGAPPEGVFFNMETKFQYENDSRILPILIESYMMNMPVKDVIAGLLQLDLLSFVSESAEKLSLHIVLPADSGDGDVLVEMEDERPMKDYRDDISRCKMIKMLKRLCKTKPGGQ